MLINSTFVEPIGYHFGDCFFFTSIILGSCTFGGICIPWFFRIPGELLWVIQVFFVLVVWRVSSANSLLWFHKMLKKKMREKSHYHNYWRFQHFCHYISFVCTSACGWCERLVLSHQTWPSAGVPKGVNTQVWKMFICGYARKATNKTVTACTIRCLSSSFSLDAVCGQDPNA